MGEETETGLTAAEEAYFESGGTAPLDAPEPEQVEGAQPDSQPEAEKVEGDQPQRDEKGRFVQQVPHAVFHAEREEHKQTKAQLAEAQAFRAAMEERMEWFKAMQPGQQAEEDQGPPDPEKDIFAALKWTQSQLAAAQKANEEATARDAAQKQAAETEGRVWQYWEQDASTYSQKNPDFGNAAKWLSDFRDKQLQAFARVEGAFSTPQARNAQIEAELRGIVIKAAQSGQSPAELVYEIAQGYGYQPGTAPNGAAAQKVQQIDKAQQANRTLTATSGSAGGDDLTLETIMNMPRSEFEVWIAKPGNEAKWNRLAGA